MLNRYDFDFDYADDFATRWNEGYRRARTWMIVLGVLLALVGVASALDPFSIYAFVQAVIAAALVVGGASQLVSYVRAPELLRSPATLVMGVLNALLGIMLLTLPAYLTAGTVVFLLAFLFIIAGAERITSARRMRYFGLPSSGVNTAVGVLNVVAGVAFLLLPVASGVVLGYVMSAYLVIGGVTLIVQGVSMRRIER